MHPDFDEEMFRELYGLSSSKQKEDNEALEFTFSNSDSDHYQKTVKRKNLVQLFLKGIDGERYINSLLDEKRKVE